MNKIDSDLFGYTVFTAGDRQFHNAASVPLTERLKAALADDDSATFMRDLPRYLTVDSRPTADGGIVLGGIVGVFAVFATWLAKKVFDDVYEIKLRPSIRKALTSADDGLEGANASKPKMLMVGVSYEDRRIFILIGIMGDTFADILASEHLIHTVHQNAVRWADANPSDSPIHLYIVDRGKMNVEPMLYDDLMSAHRYIRSVERAEE